MALDERSRHSMYSRLKELMGEEDAAALMEHLPPVGWADVATKTDLDALGNSLRAEFYKAMNHQTNVIVSWMVGAMAVLTAATAGITATVG